MSLSLQLAVSLVLLVSDPAFATGGKRFNSWRLGRSHLPVDSSAEVEHLRSEIAVSLESAGVLRSPAEGAAATQGDKASQPVAMQIEDKVVENLENKLSPACRTRFKAMVNQKGPDMSSFSAHGAPNKEATEKCKKLEGGLCHTQAMVVEEAEHTDGRQLRQKMSVVGNSCLPDECTNDRDLTTLAVFMQQQTKQLMPGDDVNVHLNVDCSKSGGGDVKVDNRGAIEPPPAGPKSAAAAVSFTLTAMAVLGATSL